MDTATQIGPDTEKALWPRPLTFVKVRFLKPRSGLMNIDHAQFVMAFGRDVDFHDKYPQSTYLDRDTGDVIWVYDCDDDADGEGIPAEDNRKVRERVATEPARYLKIPGLDHGQRHEILRLLLDSDWIDDDARRQRAKEAYFRSIGGWKKNVCDEEAVHAFRDFKKAEIATRAEGFLRENGIVAGW